MHCSLESALPKKQFTKEKPTPVHYVDNSSITSPKDCLNTWKHWRQGKHCFREILITGKMN